MAYKINWTDKGVYVTSFGVVKTEDVFEVIGVLVGDSRFDSINYLIKDFQNVTEFVLKDFDLTSISTLTTNPTKWNPNLKSCFITKDPKLQKMFLQFIEIMKFTNWETKIFDSSEDAIEWCNQE